jgi:hypothetical protein
MNLDSIPIKEIELVELTTGHLLEDLFKPDNKSPYRKRAIAYLTAKSRGEEITWEETGNKTISELAAMMAVDDDDPKAE